MKIIRSRENPTFKRLLRLAGSSRERKSAGATVLDGEHLIEAYADVALGEVVVIAASESGLHRPSIAKLMADTPARERVVIDDRLFARISQVVSPSGVLAVIDTPAAPTLPLRIEDAIYLEGIQDPGNLGSILRSSLAAGVTRILLSTASVFAWSPKVVRAGMGAHFRLAIHEGVELHTLRGRTCGLIVATGSHAKHSVLDCDLRGPVVWMFGNEGAGLTPEARAMADEQIRIPMASHTESLNVAAAAAVCLFEQRRQRQMGQ